MFKFIVRIFRRRRLHLRVVSVSEKGLVREENQDSLYVNRRQGVFAVADGMGGGEGGAAASAIVCGALRKSLRFGASFHSTIAKVSDAIRFANSEIRRAAVKAGYRHMGSTVTAFMIDRKTEKTAVIGYVGDSRVYRSRFGTLTQLTYDHTMTGELMRRSATKAMFASFSGRNSPLAHVLTRAAGAEEEVHPDWCKIDLRRGDRYLICTDGVYDELSDGEIREFLKMKAPLREISRRLSAAIEKAGAGDNYSFIIIETGRRD